MHILQYTMKMFPPVPVNPIPDADQNITTIREMDRPATEIPDKSAAAYRKDM